MDRLAHGRANRAIMDDFTACPCSDLPLLLCHRFKRDLRFVINLRLVKPHPDGQRFAVQNVLAGRVVEPWSGSSSVETGKKKPERAFRLFLKYGGEEGMT